MSAKPVFMSTVYILSSQRRHEVGTCTVADTDVLREDIGDGNGDWQLMVDKTGDGRIDGDDGIGDAIRRR